MSVARLISPRNTGEVCDKFHKRLLWVNWHWFLDLLCVKKIWRSLQTSIGWKTLATFGSEKLFVQSCLRLGDGDGDGF